MEFEYSQSRVHTLLNKLEISQDSITSASNILLNIGKSYGVDVIKSLVNDWNHIFTKFMNLEKMGVKVLAMMYLANDLIQNAKNNRQNQNCLPFLDLFKDVLSKHMKPLIEQADPALKTDLQKILLIWKERKVYPDEWLAPFLSLFKGTEESLPDNLITIPSDLIVFAQSYVDYVRWKEKTEENCNNLKPLENMMLIENFDEVKTDCELANYKRSLEIQNKYRTTYLRHTAELLKNIEKNHAKMVFNLKNVSKTLYDIEVLEEKLKNDEL